VNGVTLSNALLCCVSVTSCAVFILRTAICVGHQYRGNTLSFHGNSGNANAPHCYVIRALHILLYMCNLDELKPFEGKQNGVLSYASYLRNRF